MLGIYLGFLAVFGLFHGGQAATNYGFDLFILVRQVDVSSFLLLLG